MSTSANGVFVARCRTTLDQLGGRAGAEDVAKHLRAQLDAGQYEQQTWMGFVGQVRNALRAKSEDGLVHAAEIGGQYVQRGLWEQGEYRYVARRLMKSSRNTRRLAGRYAAECHARYGVVIDLETILDDEEYG